MSVGGPGVVQRLDLASRKQTGLPRVWRHDAGERHELGPEALHDAFVLGEGVGARRQHRVQHEILDPTLSDLARDRLDGLAKRQYSG